MKIYRYLIILALLPSHAWACMSFLEDPALLAREAARGGFVQIGYVTGANYPDYEAALIRSGKSEHPLEGRRVVRVTFTESLTGKISGPMELTAPCWAGEPKLGARAIVYIINGADAVQPLTPEHEKQIRDEFAKLPRGKR